MNFRRIVLITLSILTGILIFSIITCQHQNSQPNEIALDSTMSPEDHYFAISREYYCQPESELSIFNYANQEYTLENFQISILLWKKLLSRSTVTNDALLWQVNMSLSDCYFQSLDDGNGKICLLKGVSFALKTTKPVVFPPYTYQEYVDSIREYSSTRTFTSKQYKNLLFSRLRWAIYQIKHHQFLIDKIENQADYNKRYRENLETMDKQLYEIAHSKIDLSESLNLEHSFQVEHNPLIN